MIGEPLGRFKDLVIDAVDPAVLGRFWSAALGLAVEELPDGDAKLVGATPQHTVWINRVPEPRSVPHRVHLDIRAQSADAVLALDPGVRIVDVGTHPWAVLADPEGGEVCVFPTDPVPAERLYEVVVHCRDAVGVGRWWAGVLGGELHLEDVGGPEPWCWVEAIVGSPFECLVFAPVDRPKTVKNRIHLDLTAPVLTPLTQAGAVVLAPAVPGERAWHVLADPEGNEFCVFVDEGA